jgi:hypothetical protein
MQFKDLMAFVNNYEAGEKPDVADLNLFFKKGISAVSSNTDALEKPVEGKWVKSGDAAIASDIAEKLISKKGYAIFFYDGSNDANLLFFDGVSFVKIDNLLRFGQLVYGGSDKGPLGVIKGIALESQIVVNPEDTAKMLREDLFDYDEDSTWIDEDDEWGYKKWSQLFGSSNSPGWGYADPEAMAWLIQIEDFEFAIMNWTKTAINDLLAYINTKV